MTSGPQYSINYIPKDLALSEATAPSLIFRDELVLELDHKN